MARFIPSYNPDPRYLLHLSLTDAVARGQWRIVVILLHQKKKEQTEDERRKAVDAFINEAQIDVHVNLGEYLQIVYSCDSEQLEKLMVRATTKEWWDVVTFLLREEISEAKKGYALKAASERASETVLKKLMPLVKCTEDLLDPVLTNLVTRGLWQFVGWVLETGVDETWYRWVLEKACEGADDMNLKCFILPHCTDVHLLETALAQLLNKGFWQSVDEVLRKGIANAKRRQVIFEASEKVDGLIFEVHLLHHCDDDQLDIVLTNFVTRRIWSTVGEILQERLVSDKQHRWAVEEASKHAEDWEFVSFMLHHCKEDMLETVLSNSVNRGLWKSVGNMLERGLNEEKHKWAFEEAMTRASTADFETFIIPYCSDDQLDAALAMSVANDQWHTVGKILKRGINDSQHRWAVEEASKRADDLIFQLDILPRCKYNHMHIALPHIVARGLWQSVGKVLQYGIHETQHIWVVEEASKTVREDVFLSIILPHAFPRTPLLPAEDIMDADAVVKNLFQRGMWRAADAVMTTGFSKTQWKWTIDEASKWADSSFIEKRILPLCDNVQLDTVLVHLVTRSMWSSVATVLQKGVSETRRKWAMRKASKKADEKFLLSHLQYFCDNDVVDSLFEQVVTRGLWECVHGVLHRGTVGYSAHNRFRNLLPISIRKGFEYEEEVVKHFVSDSQLKWAIEEASKRADDVTFSSYLLYYCKEDKCDEVVNNLVSRGLWQSVGQLLEHKGISVTQRRWAIEEAIKRTEEKEFISYILRRGTKGLLDDSALTHLTTRGFWPSIDIILQAGMLRSDDKALEEHDSDTLPWVFAEASKKANDKEYCQYILPHCSMDQLDSALPLLVRRGLWQSVGKALKIVTNDTQRRHAVEEASKHASSRDFKTYILRYCSENQVESVLSNLEARGLLCTEKSGDVSVIPRELPERDLCFHILRKRAISAVISYHLACGCAPLGSTDIGKTLLLYAVRNHRCPRKMVAECIRQGLSTHQPSLSEPTENLAHAIEFETGQGRMFGLVAGIDCIKSPFLLAVILHLYIVAHMLYESGSCSNTELYSVHRKVKDAIDPFTEEGKQLQGRLARGFRQNQNKYSEFVKRIETFMPLLKYMATTPRSLMSMCRLVISHSLKVNGRRHRDVQQLPLSDKMKDYVMFSDITDPKSSTYRYGTHSDETEQANEDVDDPSTRTRGAYYPMQQHSDDSDDSDDHRPMYYGYAGYDDRYDYEVDHCRYVQEDYSEYDS